MKKLIVFALLLFAIPAIAFDPTTITFKINSTSATSTPNLRVGYLYGTLARDGNTAIQAMVTPRGIGNYYLTKTQTITFTGAMNAILIQVDQDTKFYSGSDLTNYLLLPANSEYNFSIK